MSTTPARSAELFKRGFLTRMAELGLTPGDFDEAMEEKPASVGGEAVGLGKYMSKGLLGLGIGVPLLGGAVLGAGARSASQADDPDLEEVKEQEMAALYRQLARDVRERAAGGQDGRFTIYPGIDGVPHRAKGVRLYRKGDPQHMQPQRGGQVRCMTFDVSDEGQKKAYEVTASRVFTMAQQGKAAICAVERHFNHKTGGMNIYLEWIERFTYDPTNKREHTSIEPGILRRS
jgi:hypothetical protein